MALIPGINKLRPTAYSDSRIAGKKRADGYESQPELLWYMDNYPNWRGLFNGDALEETVSVSNEDGSTDETFRWPVRYNLVNSYCLLHAGLLWGRGRTGQESNDLFQVRVDAKVPGKKTHSVAAPDLEDLLQHFWSQQSHILRPNSVIQQWAGGCVIKVSWNPTSPSAVFGIQLETVQPEYFFPIWDPLNFQDLFAAKIKFSVTRDVAMQKYGLTKKDLEDQGEDITVEEYWDRTQYYVILGKTPDSKGIVGRLGPGGEAMIGQNPWIHPVTGLGVIPIVYVPRIRTGGFLGDSLAYHLEGVQSELNKTLADYGDALTRGAHPAFGISDYQNKEPVITIPKHGALNMGTTKPGGTSPSVHKFPMPAVPPQTGEFTDRLLTLSESAAGLTPAARGQGTGHKSGIAVAMEMLPTTNLVDWSRSHWGHAIAGRAGINEVVTIILLRKYGKVPNVPAVSESMVGLRQDVLFKPVVPRDRLDIIDEVVRLSTAQAVSPQEWLKRLGDIEDIDEEMKQLISYLAWVATKEAAVAGRALQVATPTNPKEAPAALPEIKTEPQPALKQPAKQPEGQKRG